VESLQVLRHCELGRASGYVSATTVTDVMYILRKHTSQADIRDAVQTLLTITDVADVLKRDITAAFQSGVKDFEDAVQAACATRINADYIVTRNVKDFGISGVPAITPGEVLGVLAGE